MEKFILSSGVDFDGENFDSVLKSVKSDSKENEKKNPRSNNEPKKDQKIKTSKFSTNQNINHIKP